MFRAVSLQHEYEKRTSAKQTYYNVMSFPNIFIFLVGEWA